MNEELEEIGKFPDYFQAVLAKELLESNEIECIITGVNLNMLDSRAENIMLIINKKDREKAFELIDTILNPPG